MIHGWKNVRCGLALALFATGCGKSDPDTLAVIGRKLGERTHLVSDNLEQTWTNFTGRVVLENRVRCRLQWDKNLAEASIEVHATDKAIELKGNLSGADQVKRALELAESTLGVEKVVNSLQIDKP